MAKLAVRKSVHMNITSKSRKHVDKLDFWRHFDFRRFFSFIEILKFCWCGHGGGRKERERLRERSITQEEPNGASGRESRESSWMTVMTFDETRDIFTSVFYIYWLIQQAPDVLYLFPYLVRVHQQFSLFSLCEYQTIQSLSIKCINGLTSW